MPYNPESSAYCALRVSSIDELKELVFKGPVTPEFGFSLCSRAHRVILDEFHRQDERGDDFFYVVLQLDIKKIESRRRRLLWGDPTRIKKINPQEINKLIMFNPEADKWEDVTDLANRGIIESFLPGNLRNVKELRQEQHMGRVFEEFHAAAAIESAI